MAYNAFDLLNFWENIGAFDVVLPFLLVFAIVYGIMSTVNIFGENKSVHVVIALALALLTIRTGMVQDFFVEVFPRLGVGLAALLVILILLGMFVAKEERRYWLWGLASVGFLIAIIVLWNSFDSLGWTSFGGGSWGEDMILSILTIAGIIGIIIAVTSSKGSSNLTGEVSNAPLYKS